MANQETSEQDELAFRFEEYTQDPQALAQLLSDLEKQRNAKNFDTISAAWMQMSSAAISFFQTHQVAEVLNTALGFAGLARMYHTAENKRSEVVGRKPPKYAYTATEAQTKLPAAVASVNALYEALPITELPHRTIHGGPIDWIAETHLDAAKSEKILGHFETYLSLLNSEEARILSDSSGGLKSQQLSALAVLYADLGRFYESSEYLIKAFEFQLVANSEEDALNLGRTQLIHRWLIEITAFHPQLFSEKWQRAVLEIIRGYRVMRKSPTAG